MKFKLTCKKIFGLKNIKPTFAVEKINHSFIQIRITVEQWQI